MAAGGKHAYSESSTQSDTSSTKLVSAIISCITSLVIYASLRFYADWFVSAQMNTILGGFVSSWLFIFILTTVSNMEMFLFGQEFQAKIPEICFSLFLAIFSAGVVHRVCATTCIFFAIIGLYFVNRISAKYHSLGVAPVENIPQRKTGSKKQK